MNHFAHPQAIVQSRRIGRGTRIWAFAHIGEGAILGANCNVGDHCYIEGGARVGDNVTIKNGVMIWEGITIGDDAFIGPGVVFTNDRQPRSPRLELVQTRYATKKWLVPTQVGRGVAIGANATIGAGLVLGEFALVGAGAVVTRDVPAHALVYGNPARMHGQVCACGQRLHFVRRQARCAVCQRAYAQTDAGVTAL